MVQELGHHVPDEREKTKNAVMTSLYGSKKEPKKEFGEGTPELNAFYKAMYQLCPGACELLQALLASWQPYALEHSWVLPDGFQARVKVMQKVEQRIEVDELASSFTYVYYENEGEEKGVKNAANVVHSIDAYVLRSLIRRCSYDLEQVKRTFNYITDELIERSMGTRSQDLDELTEEVDYYMTHYQRSGMSEVVILPYLDFINVRALTTPHLKDLNRTLSAMLEHKPFEIITIHDDFRCHGNHMNHLRAHYRDILAELAEGNLLDDVLSQVNGFQGHFPKKSTNLGSVIRQSSYALS
jgi:hypothetical protein